MMKPTFLLLALAALLIISCSKPKEPIVPSPTGPVVPVNGSISIMAYGAVADGKTDNTAIIQKAIFDCSLKSATLIFPKGTYYTKPLFLASNVTLNLEEGSVILGSPNKIDYDKAFPNAGAIETSALIYGKDLQNVTIKGTGKIDGQGGSSSFQLGNGAEGRPKLMLFVRVKNLNIEQVELTGSAFWTAHFLLCDGVKIKGIKLYAHSNWNNDGLDIDSRNVEISDCYIDSDDDAICLKSDRNVFAENVTVTNCIIKTNCNGIKFGTASKQGFKNVNISNCKISAGSVDKFRKWKSTVSWLGITKDITAVSGIALEAVDGGSIDGVNISNIEMVDVHSAIFIRLGDRMRAFSTNISSIKNVTISDIKATSESKLSSSITGVPGGIIDNVTIKNLQMTVKGGGTTADVNAIVPEVIDGYPENRMFGVVLPAYGFYVRHAKNITFDNVITTKLTADARPEYKFDNVTNYLIK
jgi:polygalacturonase